MNSNKIDSLSLIDESKLHSDNYFASLMTAAQQCGLLLYEDINRISKELFSLLCDVCYGISQKGTSSVKIETAEDISNSIMYCISVNLKKCRTADEAAKLVKESKIETLYYDGLKDIYAMLNSARAKYTIIKKNLFKTENEYFNVTVGEGIKTFFALYDSKTAAHKSVILFDYPLYNYIPALAGAEYVCVRIENLLYENNFCIKFDFEKVHKLLCALDAHLPEPDEKDGVCAYLKMPVNIYSYVLAAALGLILCGKDPILLNAQSHDVNMLEHTFRRKSYEQVLAILNEAADKLFCLLSLDEKTERYAAQSVRELAHEIAFVGGRNVKHLFLCPSDYSTKPAEKQNGALMSDEDFRFLIEQIEKNDSLSKKAALISENVKCAEDFEDVVECAKLSSEQTEYCIKKASNRLFLLLVYKYRFKKSKDSNIVSNAVEAVVNAMPDEKRKRLEEIVASIK